MGKKRTTPEFNYSDTFDRLMSEHFGEEFVTEWNICAGVFGSYVTTRKSGKKLTKQMVRVGRSISDAIQAGRTAGATP